MTAAQARAVETLWDRYVIADDALDTPVETHFGRDAILGVEIGFGMGRELAAWARAAPEWNLLGIEVYQPGIGALLNALANDGIDNVRVVEGEAVSFLARLPDASLSEVRVLFPDPWPKKRHHRRRLINAVFLATLSRVLKPGGELVIATDWQPYAEEIALVFADQPAFRGERRDRHAALGDQTTPFERKGLAKGHVVSEFRFYRVD